MGLNITSISQKAIDTAFRLASQLLRAVVFKKIVGYSQNQTTGVTTTTISAAAVNALVVNYTTRDFTDGIVYGDEKWIVKNSELTSISVRPASGDWFEYLGNRFDILNAILDASGNVWIFQVRRQIFVPTETITDSEDWGSLAAETSSEDWGDLTLYTSATDWNA